MNRLRLHTTVTDDEMKIVDRIAEKIGYASRTELVTALLRCLIHSKPFRKDTVELNAILTAESRLSEIRDAFFEVIDEYAFPVIAMHGADYTYRVLAEDIKAWMYKKCRAVPQDADIKEWMKIYAAVKKGEIISYRIEQTTKAFAEELEEKENEAYA